MSQLPLLQLRPLPLKIPIILQQHPATERYDLVVLQVLDNELSVCGMGGGHGEGLFSLALVGGVVGE